MAITDLENKQVLVTGAASGIGRAAALAFAKRGAHIIASDVNPAALEALKKEVEALGVRCMTYVVDVSDEAAMRRFADAVHGKVGAVDVLINNAGIGYLGHFLKSDLAHWDRVMKINLMGVVHGCYHFIPKMVEAGGPRQVLNVASSAANYPMPTMAAYAASKYAVAGLSEVLKMELSGTSVGVMTVCPGVINTAIVKSAGNVAPSITQDQLSKLQAYYETKGAHPDVVAEDMVRAVQNGQDLLLTGPYAKLVHNMKRLSVGAVRTLTLDSARKIGFL